MLPEVHIELDWRGKRYRDIERGLAAFGKDVVDATDRMRQVVRKEVEAYMKGVVSSVRDRVSAPYPGGTSRPGQYPGSLSRRSGGLYKSLNPEQVRGRVTDQDIEARFTLSGIAIVHEKGATIRPKKAQYLTVPLPAALTARGLPKLPSARHWRDTFILKSKRGNLLIVQKRGKALIPLYVLKKFVVIPPRLNFEDAFLAGKDYLADRIAQEVIREFYT